MERRTFLATTGAGAGIAVSGAGAGTVSAAHASSTDGPTVVTTVEATGTHGFITPNSETPDGQKQFSLLDSESGQATVEGTVQLSGEIYDNGTWQMTSVSLPTYSLTEYDVSLNLVATDHSTPGTFDPANGIVTAPLTLDLEPDGVTTTTWPISLTFTSGASGEMTGSVNRPAESVLDATLVNNEYGLNTTEGSATPSVAQPFDWGAPGMNWFELGLEMTVADPSALDGVEVGPAPVVGNTPPQDLDGDGLYENVRGDGEFDITDVQTLFNNLDTETVQSASAAFNFSGGDPDRVTVLDVQGLFSQLRRS
jgi:hypothetical protein